MIDKTNISIIVPVYNEELSIEAVVKDLLEHFSSSEIIIVNDGSTDGTVEILKKLNVKVVNHSFNRGYGAAIKSGIKEASHGVIVTIDADGEHAAKSIEPLVKNYSGCVMAVAKRVYFREYNILRTFGKKTLWVLANLAVGRFIPDINSGLRIFDKQFIKEYMHLLPDTYSFHTTSTLLCLFKKKNLKYILTETFERKGESKVDIYSGFASIQKILYLMLAFFSARFFLLLSMPVLFVIFLFYMTVSEGVSLFFLGMFLLSFAVICFLLRYMRIKSNLIVIVR